MWIGRTPWAGKCVWKRSTNVEVFKIVKALLFFRFQRLILWWIVRYVWMLLRLFRTQGQQVQVLFLHGIFLAEILFREVAQDLTKSNGDYLELIILHLQ